MIEEVKIASVHFAPLRADRGRPLRHYSIPAAKARGEEQILIVRHALDYDEGPYNRGPADASGNPIGREKIERLIYAMDIAKDLLQEWTQSGIYMGPNDEGQEARPGVWIVRDHVLVTDNNGVQQLDIRRQLVFRTATSEEFQQMWEEDRANAIENDARYADRLIKKGIGIFNDPKGHAGIPLSVPMRLAAKFYGVAANYLLNTTSTGVQECPYCRENISALAVVCPKCQKTVNEYEYMQIQRREKAAAAERAAALKTA